MRSARKALSAWKNVQAVRPVAQDVVRAAAHDDAALVLGEVLEDVLCWMMQQPVGDGQAAAAGALRVHDPVEEKAAGGAGVFAALEYVALGEAALLCDLLDELLVIVFPAEPLGRFLCDGPAAAAELAADGYYPNAHFCASFFQPRKGLGRLADGTIIPRFSADSHIFSVKGQK